jgi:hypothetical protein
MYNNLLNNNTNIIMLIMTLIIIGLLIYIIKITKKENKEGFATVSSTFGGLVFSADDTTTPKKLNIMGDIATTGTITSNSIKIGEATLSWDPSTNRLLIDKGFRSPVGASVSGDFLVDNVKAVNVTATNQLIGLNTFIGAPLRNAAGEWAKGSQVLAPGMLLQ